MKKSSLSSKMNKLNGDMAVPKKEESNRPNKRQNNPSIKTELTQRKNEEKKSQTKQAVKTDDIEEELPDLNKPKRNKTKGLLRAVHVVLILLCIYAVFLIYGAVVTTFEYETSGKVTAQRMDVSDIEQKNEYEKIYYYYEACRGLYENTLLLDYRLGAGVEDPLVIAPEYESLLDTVENLSVKTDALTVDTKYSQVKSMMLSWIQDDIAVYLQNMSSAISENDTDTANNALQDQDRVYSDFMLITQNMAAFGEKIKGVDMESIRNWTPENYIDEEINGEET